MKADRATVSENEGRRWLWPHFRSTARSYRWRRSLAPECAQRILRLAKLRVDAQRFPEFPSGLIEASLFREQEAEVRVRGRVVRLELERSRQLARCAVQLTHADVHRCEVGDRRQMPRVARDRLLVFA